MVCNSAVRDYVLLFLPLLFDSALVRILHQEEQKILCVPYQNDQVSHIDGTGNHQWQYLPMCLPRWGMKTRNRT